MDDVGTDKSISSGKKGLSVGAAELMVAARPSVSYEVRARR